MSLTIRIPASIDLRLTPNRANTNRHVKARLRNDLKETTGKALLGIDRDAYADAVLPLTLDYVIARGKGRQLMDDTNIKAGLKYVEDAIAEYLGINDKHFRVGTVTQIRDVDGVGWIEATITPSVDNERERAA